VIEGGQAVVDRVLNNMSDIGQAYSSFDLNKGWSMGLTKKQ